VAKVIYAWCAAEEALGDCHAAIQLDKNLGDAYYYRAICNADNKEYALAISDMHEACRLHGHFEDYDKTVGARWISYWQEDLENPDDAIQTLEDALREYPDDLEAVTQYVQLATRTNRFEEVATCLQNLRAKLPGFLLSEEAEGIQRYIRRAAQMTRRVNSLKRAYEAALKNAQSCSDEKGIARTRKALFMIRAENQEEDKAIELFKEVYQIEDGPKQLGDWGRYMGNLYELLFWGAHLNGEGSEKSGEYLTSLIYAEKNEHSPDSNALTYDSYIGGLFLGQLYQLHSRSDESKVYFKDRVALAMSLLEDYDVSNDWQAYDILSETLFKAGDEVNGKAARILFLHEWRKSHIDNAKPGDDPMDPVTELSDEAEVSNGADTSKSEIRAPHDINGSTTLDPTSIETLLRVTTQEINISEASIKIQAGNSVKTSNMQANDPQVKSVPQAANQDGAGNQTVHDAKDAEEPPTYTPWDYSSCDGPCLRDYDDSDEMIHVCIYCYDTTYCEKCFNTYVIAGTLPYKKCDPTHQFVTVTGPPKDLDDAKVVIRDSIQDREEWLNSIRKAWGLDEWHPVTPGGFATIDAAVENVSMKETGEEVP
jgi:tetratricopeptide (TPR) repeat protein